MGCRCFSLAMRKVWPESWTVFANVGSVNQMNKLSLVGMQLPGNIRRISTIRAKALRLGLLVGVGKITWAFTLRIWKHHVTKNKPIRWI
jgi:hypothetical protein